MLLEVIVEAALASTVAVLIAAAVLPPTEATTLVAELPVTLPANVTEPAVVELVAVVALPLREAVMVPATKLPEPSRLTIALVVFADVAALTTVLSG